MSRFTGPQVPQPGARGNNKGVQTQAKRTRRAEAEARDAVSAHERVGRRLREQQDTLAQGPEEELLHAVFGKAIFDQQEHDEDGPRYGKD